MERAGMTFTPSPRLRACWQTLATLGREWLLHGLGAPL